MDMWNEFIDDGGYGKIPPPIHPVWYKIPTSFVRLFADPAYQSGLYSDPMVELQESIAKHGILTPLELRVDPLGQAKLQEGNHRLIVAERLSVLRVPLKIKRVPTPMTKGWRKQLIIAETLPLLDLWLDLLERA